MRAEPSDTGAPTPSTHLRTTPETDALRAGDSKTAPAPPAPQAAARMRAPHPGDDTRPGRPFVTWVVDHGTPAPDLDALRSAADTLVVSTWAVLAHDVSLAVLDPDGTPSARQPLRVVLGTRDLDPGLPVFDAPGRTLHFATRDPHLALQAIDDLGGRHVLLDGGPALASEFLRAGLVDEVVTHVSPELSVGGIVGAMDLGVGNLPESFVLRDVRVLGDGAGQPLLRVTLGPDAGLVPDAG
ncbi:dihydrofolate reductase family protein [Sanguibacter sp. 4.1]|uniref:Dihydrofolate reductase family protein n=1 Tax=Sanguibacter biliveldensis TaxID=3030830 RepID=A0AAF0Z448_9MICO|nr:dihydrofolate reductase family protein [Sanguibacter sp. 4.1]WPF82200.1 dihydrofolate reductase family protein [Sanguibacter sp. 4.1]